MEMQKYLVHDKVRNIIFFTEAIPKQGEDVIDALYRRCKEPGASMIAVGDMPKHEIVDQFKAVLDMAHVNINATRVVDVMHWDRSEAFVKAHELYAIGMYSKADYEAAQCKEYQLIGKSMTQGSKVFSCLVVGQLKQIENVNEQVTLDQICDVQDKLWETIGRGAFIL